MIKKKELRTSVLCVIAFTVGCVVFLSGCAVSGRTHASVLDKYTQLDAGVLITRGNEND